MKQTSPLPKIKKPKTMSFGEAMDKIAKGEKVTRKEWPKGEYGLMKDGWLMIYTRNAFFVWKVGDGDILASDWIIYEEPKLN